jgi:electron transport complex protein RnfB
MSEHASQHAVVEKIDAWLPQTQCTQCGYPRCRAYAEAVAEGKADINQCPPGNEVTIHALATLLHTPPKPLDPRFGVHKPRAIAVIDENVCIGCRKCLDVCPVDAILGARKRMHTVIAQECTGCALCLPPCPVDCIAMVPVAPVPNTGPWPDYARAETDHWRTRNEKRLWRLAQRKQARRASTSKVVPTALLPSDANKIRAEIYAAVERVRAKKSQRNEKGS